MNTKNNKRRRESQEKIGRAFVELLQSREIKDITVSDLIKKTGLNRSTFYANYVDIFDLADKTREILEQDFSNLFADYDYFNERSGALKMFQHIKKTSFSIKPTSSCATMTSTWFLHTTPSGRSRSILITTSSIISNFSETV